ncbi:hypothetical protein [Lichenibacterium dinghuense]|uniref:hypothetical protein n=1 Tax=Lichenibacterium dinghuense TaxID=2895977 RepID=UPI001F1ED3B3|nr:hypothetical protein [Lichenibacterium sp. 6Y81]
MRVEAGAGRSSGMVAMGLRRAVMALDAHLSRQNGVVPFSDDEDCILRIALVPARRTLLLSDGAEIRAGDTVADVHCWNERIPAMPVGGADLAWAQKASLRLRRSLELLAHAMATEPGLSVVKACRANVNFVGLGGSNRSVSRIIARLGYEDVDEGVKPIGTRLHEALENLLIGALVWTHNPEALRREKIVRERRPVWSSRAMMLALHAASPSSVS